MEEKLKSFKVKEIAHWDLRSKNKNISNLEYKISLPDIQRGFVWKADRIEDLWDSVFRGFPIGSFLISESGKSEFDLLDGQQRATSIEVGLNNPWFNKLKCKSLLWLDISRDKSGPFKYQFKLINSSNPWGVDSRKKTLDSDNRKNAIAEFKRNIANAEVQKFYEFDLKNCWPWDSKMPIPFCFFKEAIDHNNDLDEQKKYLGSIISKRLNNITRTKDKEKGYKKSIEEFIASSDLDDLLKKVTQIMESEIPAILLNKELINRQEDLEDDELKLDWGSDISNTGTTEEDSDKKDIIELIFERVNSKGFPLEGDELIYSIFKSQCHEAKFIPDRCEYIKPSRLVIFCVKIIIAQSKEGRNTIPGKIKILEFKRWLTLEQNLSKLTELLATLTNDDNIFNKAKNIIFGSLPYQFSYYQLVDFVETYPDAFWVLLFRLHRGDKIELENHPRVLGFITTLGWFGKTAKRQTLPAIREIWKDIIKKSESEFWSSSTLGNAVGYNKRDEFVLLPMPSPKYLKKIFDLIIEAKSDWYDLDFEDLDLKGQMDVVKFFKKYFDTVNDLNDENDDAKNLHLNALDKLVEHLRDCEGILAYASRDVIKDWFDDFYMNGLEDFEQPWDRDHIFATKLLTRRKIFQVNILKSWQNTIGNIRYWPLELNRGAGASNPRQKFNFDLNSADRIEFARYNIASEADILKKSLITTDWKDIGDEDQNKKENSKLANQVTTLILMRILDMYTQWYNNLKIEELFPPMK